MIEADPLTATLTVESSDDTYIPVKFDAAITELGMFELWCVECLADDGSDERSPGKWKLEFNIRQVETAPA